MVITPCPPLQAAILRLKPHGSGFLLSCTGTSCSSRADCRRYPFITLCTSRAGRMLMAAC